MPRDYYEILEVGRQATAAEIKKSYRRLAVKYHPDKNPGDAQAEEQFKELAQAFEVLSDSRKRQIYDQFGHDGLKGRGFGFHDPGDIFQQFMGAAFGGGIFGDIFGFGGGRRSGPSRGAAIDYELEISLEEAAFGTEKKINIFRRESCPHCRGEGSEPGTPRTPCAKCHGSGKIRQERRTFLGVFATESVCPECRGEGSISRNPCRECGGSRVVEKEKEITVNIPPGVGEGSVLRMRGGGEVGPMNGPPGDLNIFLRVSPHPIFQRSGDDIVCEVPISYPRAALGGEIRVPILKGHTGLKIPPGTQGGEVFRLRNQGIPHLHGSGRGDEHVRVVVEVPSRLNKKQREMLNQLEESFSDQNRPLHRSFTEKFHDFLGKHGVKI
ncbi:MAG: molecular chaperone DnaJ [Candidatus Auribacterota bacterium]|nr:molecular chaperone DnaJ [Candidatus Auribacterota bacterium]